MGAEEWGVFRTKSYIWLQWNLSNTNSLGTKNNRPVQQENNMKLGLGQVSWLTRCTCFSLVSSERVPSYSLSAGNSSPGSRTGSNLYTWTEPFLSPHITQWEQDSNSPPRCLLLALPSDVLKLWGRTRTDETQRCLDGGRLKQASLETAKVPLFSYSTFQQTYKHTPTKHKTK